MTNESVQLKQLLIKVAAIHNVVINNSASALKIELLLCEAIGQETLRNEIDVLDTDTDYID